MKDEFEKKAEEIMGTHSFCPVHEDLKVYEAACPQEGFEEWWFNAECFKKAIAAGLRTQYLAGLEKSIEIVENLCGSCPGELTGGTCQFSDAIRQEIERVKGKV